MKQFSKERISFIRKINSVTVLHVRKLKNNFVKVIIKLTDFFISSKENTSV